MPETAAATTADRDCTDFTTMDDAGVELVIDPAARDRLGKGGPGRLAAGVRLIFRASLSRGGGADGGRLVAVDSRDEGRVGCLPHDVGERYRPVLDQLQRAGRVGVCAGYLQRSDDGSLRARLLLHEPYECLRRIEADLLDAVARGREERSA